MKAKAIMTQRQYKNGTQLLREHWERYSYEQKLRMHPLIRIQRFCHWLFRMKVIPDEKDPSKQRPPTWYEAQTGFSTSIPETPISRFKK